MRNQFSKLRSVALLGFIAIYFSSQGQSFGFFELENLSNLKTEHYFRPQVNIYSNTFKTNHKVGTYYFALVNKFWGEAYGGVIYKPVDWLFLSVGAGLEVDKNPYRFNIRVQVLKDKIHFLQIYEYGGSGFWYHVEFDYQYMKHQSIGVLAKRYYGMGLVYEYEINRIPLRLIAAPLYDFEDEDYKLLLALRYYL